MTPEQYQRAIEIQGRLNELAEVKKAISETTKCRLDYMKKDCDGDYRPISKYTSCYIAKLYDKHDLLIRQEIEDEITALKKEIETL